MREWLKNHGLELASLVVAVVGVKGLTDFWARLQEMFSSYSTEALFSCGLAAAAAAIVATYFARSGYRRRIAAKDAEIASLEAELAGRPTREELAERDAKIASLEGQLQMAKVPGAVAGLKAMAAAASPPRRLPRAGTRSRRSSPPRSRSFCASTTAGRFAWTTRRSPSRGASPRRGRYTAGTRTTPA